MAKEGARLKDFFKLLKKLIDQIYSEELGWNLVPEASIYGSDPENINTPLITYKIKHRTFLEGRTGRKPVWKEEYEDKNDIHVTNYSQQFATIIEFGFLGASYEEADDAREEFEVFMLDYLDEFLKEGMLQVVFSEQLEDKTVKIKEQYFPQQRVLYYVINERIKKKIDREIKNIETEIIGPTNYLNIKNQLKFN